MNKLEINNSILEVYVGDLTKSEDDAIVIDTNPRLLPSGKMRIEVLREAGAKVQVECNTIMQKIGGMQTCGAVMTSGGDLPAKHIIHAAGPKLGDPPEGKKLMFATWNSIKLADEAGLKTIAFYPLSIENHGFTAKIIANVMLPTIKKYLTEVNKNLKKVSICIEFLPDYKDFEDVLASLS